MRTPMRIFPRLALAWRWLHFLLQVLIGLLSYFRLLWLARLSNSTFPLYGHPSIEWILSEAHHSDQSQNSPNWFNTFSIILLGRVCFWVKNLIVPIWSRVTNTALWLVTSYTTAFYYFHSRNQPKLSLLIADNMRCSSVQSSRQIVDRN